MTRFELLRGVGSRVLPGPVAPIIRWEPEWPCRLPVPGVRLVLSRKEVGARVLLSLSVAVCLTVGARAGVTEETLAPLRFDWRRVLVSGGPGPVNAVAYHADSGWLAAGDAQGVSLNRFLPGGEELKSEPVSRRFSRVGVVQDLLFEPAGSLWVASDRGLWWLGGSGRLEDRSPGPGEPDRFVHRIQVLESWHVAATEGGAFVSLDGMSWTRLGDGLPLGPIYSVALRALSPDGERLEVWLTGARDVWSLELEKNGRALQLGSARRMRPPGRPTEERPVDLATDIGGSEVVVLYPRALARILPARVARARWETVFPVWPPGSRARRLVALDSNLWLATDQGLLSAAEWPLTWHRTTGPPGGSKSWALAGSGRDVFVATEAGLFWGRADGGAFDSTQRFSFTASPSGRDASPEGAAGPPLRAIHARALSYSGLRPEYFRRLRTGLDESAWWPELQIDAGVAYDRDIRQDHDQSFTYGRLHDLRDRGFARSRDLEASLTLTWNFADIMYPTDAPELSREARQVISLRGNLLDEINQLYFDRLRTLVAWEAYADKSDPEAVLLELRSEELAAGLDAWTGGWFSAWRPAGSEEESFRGSSFPDFPD